MHALPVFRAIEEERLDLRNYGRLIGMLGRFHGAVAAALARSAHGPLSNAPRRLAALRRDAAAIGAGVLPEPPDWTLDSDAAALGALYVSEGSALGGRVIARRLDYLFGRSAQGRTFFAGTAEDRTHWRRVAALLAEPREQDQADEAVAAAEGCFALFERCMEPLG
jgi:heme oxygenase